MNPSTPLSLLMIGAALVWACSGTDTTSSELSGSSAATTATSSSSTGGGKDLPCGPSKTCASACCLVTNDAGIYCSPTPDSCPATALVKTECSGASDCGSGQVCCGAVNTTFHTYCRAYCNDGELTFCDGQADCAKGTCQDITWNGPTGYKTCK